MTVRTKLYCRLREIMDERHLAVYQLAKLSGVGRDTIGALRKNNWHRVDREVLGKICGALEVCLDELFDLREEDIWFAIRLHREVTIHLGSNSAAALVDSETGNGSPTAFYPQSIGAWDFRAFRVLTKHLAKLGRDITVRSEDHEGDVYQGFDPSRGDSVEELLGEGDHIIIGSPIANRLAEELVCRLFGVTPHTPSKRDAFPFGFVWDSRRSSTPSSFGWEGHGKEFGIADIATGKLVARGNIVAQGEGDDCALIVTYRIWQPPKQRRFGRDDERIIICILGFSGAGTYAAAKVATDPRYAAALYPPTSGAPLMRPVAATYTRPATASLQDNRRVVTQSLVEPDTTAPASDTPADADTTAPPPDRPAAGKGRPRPPARH